MLAFLLGAVTGGVIALLLAPEKGEVTRRKIREGAADVYGKGRNWTGAKGRDLREKAGSASDWVKGKVGEASDSARHQVDAVKSAVAEGKEAYRREMEKT
jgi:gas vesicle protein